jgi:hypothetical protein
MKTLHDVADYKGLVARVQSVRQDSPRKWGRMTAHGMLCHLSDSFLLPLGRRHATPASGLFQRTVMKWGALWVPMQWPHGFKTRPEMEQGVGGTPPDDFERDRAQLLAVMREFTSDPLAAPHPIFGSMTRKEWMRWGWLHVDHHLRQFSA